MSIRRTVISLFIGWALYAQLSVNVPFALPSPTELQTRYPKLPYRVVDAYFYAISRPLWFGGYLGWLTGISTRWRMFSPPDFRNWRFHFIGVGSDGSRNEIPLFNDPPRDFWQRNFSDLRFEKFYLNIYGSEMGRSAFLQHLCHRFAGKFVSIELHHSYHEILPLAEAGKTGQRVAPDKKHFVWEEQRCTP